MLLGKRPRPPMKRTTSLSDIIFDLGDSSPSHQQTNHTGTRPKQPDSVAGAGGFGVDQRLLSSLVSPTNNDNLDHRRHNSADFLETPHFLKSCGLCKRRLVPGRDIYMYRGDSAFCSLECRQQQMNQDERKEKCSFASSKKQAAGGAGSQVSTKGETLAAAAAV